jgi:hypothetical protein
LDLNSGFVIPYLRHVVDCDQKVAFNPFFRPKLFCGPGSTVEELLKAGFHLIENICVLNPGSVAVYNYGEVKFLRKSSLNQAEKQNRE